MRQRLPSAGTEVAALDVLVTGDGVERVDHGYFASLRQGDPLVL